jgi:soluble lytic murein transglycosylase-like protein
LKKSVFLFFCLFLFLPRNIFGFCFEEAGKIYGISPQLLWSIAKVESNFDPGAINRNHNGTYDFGIMQINSSWYQVLGKKIWNRLGDPCTNVHVGAWVLAQCIQRHGNTWEAIGCYNTSSKSKRIRYAVKVYDALREGLKQDRN